MRNLYIIIGLSRWPRGVADVNGRGSGGRHARAASSERGQTTCADRLRALAKGEGTARCVAYEAWGYKQAVQTDGRANVQADGPNRAKIARSVARFWLVRLMLLVERQPTTFRGARACCVARAFSDVHPLQQHSSSVRQSLMLATLDSSHLWNLQLLMPAMPCHLVLPVPVKLWCDMTSNN